MLVEVYDKHLILRIAGSGKLCRGGDDIGNLPPHASAVVDDESYRDRNVLMTEQPDLLRHAILVDQKGFLGQIANRLPIVVRYSDVECDQVYVNFKVGLGTKTRNYS